MLDSYGNHSEKSLEPGRRVRQIADADTGQPIQWQNLTRSRLPWQAGAALPTPCGASTERLTACLL